MNKIIILFLFGAASICSCSVQRGEFNLFEVTPKSAQDIQALKGVGVDFEDHPPIFLLKPRPGKSTLMLIEQSQLSTFTNLLRRLGIQNTSQGLTLVQSIDVHPQQNNGPLPRSGPALQSPTLGALPRGEAGCSFKYSRSWCWRYCNSSKDEWCYTRPECGEKSQCDTYTACDNTFACGASCDGRSAVGCVNTC